MHGQSSRGDRKTCHCSEAWNSASRTHRGGSSSLAIFAAVQVRAREDAGDGHPPARGAAGAADIAAGSDAPDGRECGGQYECARPCRGTALWPGGQERKGDAASAWTAAVRAARAARAARWRQRCGADRWTPVPWVRSGGGQTRCEQGWREQGPVILLLRAPVVGCMPRPLQMGRRARCPRTRQRSGAATSSVTKRHSSYARHGADWPSDAARQRWPAARRVASPALARAAPAVYIPLSPPGTHRISRCQYDSSPGGGRARRERSTAAVAGRPAVPHW